MSDSTDSPSKLEQRAKEFMQTFNADDIKRRKEEQTVELRKNKRADIATKRRNFQSNDRDWVKVNEQYKKHYSLEDLPELLESLRSSESERHLFAAQGLRKLLSIEHQPPIQEVIDAGAVPILIEWIQRFDFPQLQFESAWALTNVASGTHQHCQVIVDKGAIPLLVKLLESPNEEVREQAVWAIGNIGGDAAHCRDIILQHNGLHLLIICVESSNKPSMIKNGSWAISNLCRGKPAPVFEMVKDAIPILAKVIIEHHDTELLTDCLWAISHLSEGGEDKIELIIDSGCVPRVIQFLSHHLYNVQLPAIRTIGNVVTGNDKQTQIVLGMGGAVALGNLLGSPKKNIRKEAVWSISNICAGSKEQLDILIAADVFTKLINIVQHDDKEIRKEAVWALSNSAAGGRPDQVAHLVQSGIIAALCSLFSLQDVKMVSVALEGINRILKHGADEFKTEQGANPFAEILEQCGGLGKLESLQEHPNTNIYEKARVMIETYFEVEEDENAQLIQMIKDSVQFNF